MSSLYTKWLPVCLIVLAGTQSSFAQTCRNQHFSLIYKGISFNSYTRSTATSTNEIIAIGDILDGHGFIAKFSPRGSPLFCYQYKPVYENNQIYYSQLRLTDIVETTEGTFLASGTVLQEKDIYPRKFVNDLGVLLKIDKYGNIIWCKKFENLNGLYANNFNLAVTNVVELTNGDIVVFLAEDYGRNYHSFGKLVCLNSSGALKWTKVLATNSYEGKLLTRRGLLQTQSKLLVVGDIRSRLDRTSPDLPALESYLHLFALNYETGEMAWEKGYQLPLPHPPSLPDKVFVSETPDRRLVFTTSLLLPASAQQPSALNAVRITTDEQGAIRQVLTYNTSDGESVELLDAAVDRQNGNATYLFKDNRMATLANISSEGGINWQQGYNNAGGRFPANCFSPLDNGYAIFNANFDTWFSRLLVTNANGLISCADSPSQLMADSLTLQPGTLTTSISVSDQNRFAISDFRIRQTVYLLEQETECQEQQNCCSDIINYTQVTKMEVCEGSSFMLPDNTVVKDSGTYYVRLKTAGGCDSISFYHLTVHKDPSMLTLGADLCFKGDTLALKATEGYSGYTWSNNTSTALPEVTVNQPGVYWVSVANLCGAKRDSITVYEQCDFPIYMPDAFTPNGDHLNDQFRVSPSNKNKLVSLRVYDRWGQLVFQTTNPDIGWDGTFSKKPLNSGVFVYYVEMMGLSGNRLTKKGTVLLIK